MNEHTVSKWFLAASYMPVTIVTIGGKPVVCHLMLCMLCRLFQLTQTEEVG